MHAAGNEGKVDLAPDLVVNAARQPHPSRLTQGLDPRRHVDAVAVDRVVGDDHVAEVDADPIADALAFRQFRILSLHRPLDLDCGFDRRDHAAELDDGAIAFEIDEATTIPGEDWLDQFLAQSF